MKPLEINDASAMSDHKRPLVRALQVAVWALVALTIVSLMAWGAARDLPGIWAVLMGVAVGGSFVLLTAVTVLATSDSSPNSTMAVVLGGWLLKMGVLVVFLLWIRGYDFYDHAAFGVTTIAALVVALAAETWGVITTRTTYLDEPST